MQIGKSTGRSGWFDPIPFLLACILVGALVWGWPITVQALSFPGAIDRPSPPHDQASFESYLLSIGRPVVSRYHGYRASFATFGSDHQLVYGTPQLVPYNRYNAAYQEYAFLGYSYDETPVSNSSFPDDSATGETYSSPWDWQELPLGLIAEVSWARLSARQQQLIQQSSLQYRQRSYGGMTFAGLQLTTETSQILTQPAWQLGFALYTRHYLPGTTAERYATLTGAGSGDVSIGCELDVLTPLVSQDTLYLPEGEDEVAIRYRVTGQIQAFSGLAQASDIAYCGAGNSVDWVQGEGNGPWVIEITEHFSRSDLEGFESKQITLTGQAWVVSQMGDIRVMEASRTITLTTVPPSPFEVDFQVSGSLNYFSRRTSATDYLATRDQRRFLGLEHLTFEAHFTHPPLTASIDFMGQHHRFDPDGVQTDFSWTLELPTDQSSLDWHHGRLNETLSATLNATAEIEYEQEPILYEQIDPLTGLSSWIEFTPDPVLKTESVTAHIHDIEITGDIHDLYRVLAG